ncbi:Putative glycoside hydrolase family 31, galactose mutarotase-like domain superfamily [Colletotrichum destructivum]|uniref:alpha-glucosidase n=1 Tax=Colletotrichum destructivum TaxID=34406 RepID=A0AAX4IW96_9PEZI|nr:Putative glycoside hydrolase family 31, galactose mutarotase-like domain superfamily [Colletotrichum destructivum]
MAPNDWFNRREWKEIRGDDATAFWTTSIWWIATSIVLVQCLWMLYSRRSLKQQFEKEEKRRGMFARAPLLLPAAAVMALCTMAGVADLGRPFAQQYLASTSIASGTSQFTVPASAIEGALLIPNIEDPESTDPQSVCPGYTASHIQTTSHGFTADLDLAGSACNVYGNDVEALSLVVEYLATDRLHVQVLPRYIDARNSTWFILPEELIPKPAADGKASSDGSNSDLEFKWTNEPTFGFNVSRKSTGDVLFTTAGTKLVFEDQFFEFASPLPENYNLYGLGEVIHSFKLNNNLTRTLYAADVGDPIDGNIYGSHPIYLDTRYYQVNSDSKEAVYVANATDKNAEYTSYTHGVFLRNSHAQEILLRESNITWRGLGGTIDLYFYAGPTADAVMKSYQKTTVGLPAMQQYWTFGFHQCRWGYTSWDNLQEVADDFAKFKIPLETIWADIDYMNQYRDFENDANSWSYEDAARVLGSLHKNGQHFVPIVDSAIYSPNSDNASDAYPTYDRGVDADAFMLNPDGSLYIGEVWPGYTVFPDWIGAVLNGSRTFEWWKTELATWSDKVAFDGIWIDMSEVSSFCVGSCGSDNLTLNPAHPPFLLPGEPGNEVLEYPEGFGRTNGTEAASVSSLSSSLAAARTATAAIPSSSPSTTTSYLRTTPTPGVRNVNYPPYVINNIQGDLAVHAVSPNATHHGGTQEYDFHNLFGHQILNATYQALLSVLPGKRPFIIGRSTFAGSGKWAGHWGGDNASLWAYMFFSIPQALAFSIFGVPMFGVDTCGFSGNTDMELCARWMQLSAFFPFYRNHNVLGAIPQEPYRWAAVADASRAAMAIRYALLPYVYTAFHRAHKQGDTVMKALAWEFADEPWLAGADRQFLLGPAVMVTPCLEQGASTVDGVFPGVGKGAVWYDWYNQSAITGVSTGQNVTIDAPLGHIPVYIRGGYVIPTQEPGLTTAESRSNPWGLLVALDDKGTAKGSLYVDDGESLEQEATLTVELSASENSLKATPSGEFEDSNSLGTVTVMGVQGDVSAVTLDGRDLDGASWTFDSTTRALHIHGLQSRTSEGAWSSAWELVWS